jgi:hypothetical protein
MKFGSPVAPPQPRAVVGCLHDRFGLRLTVRMRVAIPGSQAGCVSEVSPIASALAGCEVSCPPIL